jgi:hypothetical protein
LLSAMLDKIERKEKSEVQEFDLSREVSGKFFVQTGI